MTGEAERAREELPQGSSSLLVDPVLARPEKLFGRYMKLQKLHRFTVCAVALVLGSLAMARVPDGAYHLLKKHDLGVAPGGKEYWDYIGR